MSSGVIARIFRVQASLPKSKPKIRALAAQLAGLLADPVHPVHPVHPGDYAQALMDLGAHVCKPKNPKCPVCPWRSKCAAFAAGDMEIYPKRAPKTTRPIRYGAVFFVEDTGQIWVAAKTG